MLTVLWDSSFMAATQASCEGSLAPALSVQLWRRLRGLPDLPASGWPAPASLAPPCQALPFRDTPHRPMISHLFPNSSVKFINRCSLLAYYRHKDGWLTTSLQKNYVKNLRPLHCSKNYGVALVQSDMEGIFSFTWKKRRKSAKLLQFTPPWTEKYFLYYFEPARALNSWNSV
jgi:hypothetical protein